MKTLNFDPDKVKSINRKYVHAVDKLYRMHGGLSSDLLSVKDGVGHLKISINSRWKKDPYRSVLHIINHRIGYDPILAEINQWQVVVHKNAGSETKNQSTLQFTIDRSELEDKSDPADSPIPALKTKKQSPSLRLVSAESVSEGHPDKIADQVSDAVLDAYLEENPNARVACECLISENYLVIAGEVNTVGNSHVDPVSIAKEVIGQIGYEQPGYGFDIDEAKYKNIIHRQSQEIANSVSNGGAGDQGLMFGYACNETQNYMPLPIFLAHRILERLAELRKNGTIPWLLPDAKAQVTVLYIDDKPQVIDNIVLSTQHMPYLLDAGSAYHGSGHAPMGHYSGGVKKITKELLKSTIIEQVIKPICGNYISDNETEYIINPSGSFEIGGPEADTGLTGRKIIVDSYGGAAPHGGGAFSGKDPSKVDRSAAYMARYVAKHIVAAGIAEKCTIGLSYAIGKIAPTSVSIDLHRTSKYTENDLLPVVQELFDFSVEGIIQTLDLKRPIYRNTAAYGHFGRDEFPWEALNKDILEELRSLQ